MIKLQNFEKLQELTGHTECMEACVGSSSIILRKDANQIVTTLVTCFEECNIPELAAAVVDLRIWQAETPSGLELSEKNSFKSAESLAEAAKGLGRSLQKVWGEGWQERKQKLLREEDWIALSNVQTVKKKLATWAAHTAPPTEQEVLREFRELMSIPAIKGWHEMEALLATAVELMTAGACQPNLHVRTA